MKKLTLIALLVFIKSIGNAQQLEVANRNSPNKVGERIITFQCPTEGIPQKDIEVWVYYSDSKEQLSKSDCPHGRATCKKNTSAPSKLDCKFYLPHSDHMTPNYILPQEKSSGQAVSESDMNEYLSSSSGSVQNMVLMSSITDKNPKSYNNPKKVYYKIVRERKAAKKTSEIFEFTMPRLFIIGYMGDSYVSGEGAPYAGSNKWDDDFCHRSNNSGGMKAINKLIRTHRELGLRVINTTCSGAKIGNIICNRHIKGNSSRKPQLDQIEDWCIENSRETIDILLMGVGGNSIGFSDFATAAIVPPGGPVVSSIFGITLDADWSNFNELKRETMSLIDELPAKYNDLNQAINAANFEVGKVLMINYPNMLFGKERKLCDGNMLNGNTSINCLDPGIQLFGHIEFFREVHTALNESIREACDKFKWEPIRVSAINKHGICNCEEPYFNSIPQSIWDQRDANGAIHPNKNGYDNLYKDNVYQVLIANIKPAQDSAYIKAVAIARADAKAKLKIDQAKKVAKELLKKQLSESRAAQKEEKETMEETKTDKQKFEIPKNFKPVQIKNQLPDEPKSSNDKKD